MKTSIVGKEWIKKEMRQYRAVILFLTCLSILSTLSSLAFAYMTRYLINSASARDRKGLLLFSCILVGLLLLRILFQTLGKYYAEKIRSRIVRDLRVRVYKDILRSNYAQIQRFHSGELLNRLTSDLQEIAATSVGLLPALVGMITQCFGAIAALITTDPLFTLIYIVCGGAFGGVAALFRKQIKKRQKAVLEADGRSRAYMQESISSLMTIKAYGAEEKSTDKSQTLAQEHYQSKIKRGSLNAIMHAVFTLLSNFGLIFAIVWCSISVLNGNTDYGTILSVILLLMQFQHPLSGFSSILPAYYARATSGERIAELQKIAKEEDVAPCSCDTVYANISALGFDNVGFTYDRDTVFSGASFKVNKGETVCLVGESGSGKSTVFKLLLSVYTPTQGEIYLDADEKRLPLDTQYRKLFAYVPQENFLFSGTIRENLTFFQDVTDERELNDSIKSALQTACAEFVYDLPQGLDTLLLEKGAGLSYGQLQRLAIARAILSKRPILLLDEATSALDGETEEKILDNIRKLQNKTCFIVTHRVAALAIADKIFVVENGAITEK